MNIPLLFRNKSKVPWLKWKTLAFLVAVVGLPTYGFAGSGGDTGGGGTELIPLTPFICTGQAFTTRAEVNGFSRLYSIDQSQTPFQFVNPQNLQIQDPIDGKFSKIIVNNIGYNVNDDFLYGVVDSQYGGSKLGALVKIGSNGLIEVVNATNLPKARLLAGDIDPDSNIMYFNTVPTGTQYWTINLSSAPYSASSHSYDTNAQGLQVADWAVNPVDHKLYGGVALCSGGEANGGKIYRLDPTSDPAEATELARDGGNLPCNDGPSDKFFGGAWFNAAGVLFLYRNNGELYKVENVASASDTIPATVTQLANGGPDSSLNDAAACSVAPLIDKFYTETNNNWAPRCARSHVDTICSEEGACSDVTVCDEYRPANVNLDDDVFAAQLPTDGDDVYVLQGLLKKNGSVTVSPGQYFAVSDVLIGKDQAEGIHVLEDFSDCANMSIINPLSIPGGVQVVKVLPNGDVEDISGPLSKGIGGSIEVDSVDLSMATKIIVNIDGPLEANTHIRVMVKFAPRASDQICDSCVNTEALISDINGDGVVDFNDADLNSVPAEFQDQATLIIKNKQDPEYCSGGEM